MKKTQVIIQRQQSQSMFGLILVSNTIGLIDKVNRYDDSFKYIHNGKNIKINPYYLKTTNDIGQNDRILADLLDKGICKERNNIDLKYIYPSGEYDLMKKIYKLSVKGKIYTVVWNNYINKYGLIENPDVLTSLICEDILLYRLLFPVIGNIDSFNIAKDYGFENIFDLKIFRTGDMQARYILQILKDPVIEIYKRTLTKYNNEITKSK